MPCIKDIIQSKVSSWIKSILLPEDLEEISILKVKKRKMRLGLISEERLEIRLQINRITISYKTDNVNSIYLTFSDPKSLIVLKKQKTLTSKKTIPPTRNFII